MHILYVFNAIQEGHSTRHILAARRFDTTFCHGWNCAYVRDRFVATVFDTSLISTSLKTHTPKTKKGFLALYSYTAAC